MKKNEIDILGFDKIYDVIHIMIMRFNPYDKILKLHMLNESMNEDIKRFDHIWKKYDVTLDPEISLFFDCTINSVSFLSRYYMDMIKEHGFIEFKKFLEIVERDARLKEKLICYYVGKYKSDTLFMNDLLLEKKYTFSAELREGMMRIVLFFETIREKLIHNMKKIGDLLDKEYKKLQEFLDKQIVDNDIDKIRHLNSHASNWFERHKKIQVKFAYINQYTIWRGDFSNAGGAILGINYEKAIKAMWNLDISIIDFCEVLGDNIRFGMLEKIKEKAGGMTIADIARETGVSVSNVIYHMEKMKKVKMVSYIMQGKTACYYLNPESIKRAIQSLESFLE